MDDLEVPPFYETSIWFGGNYKTMVFRINHWIIGGLQEHHMYQLIVWPQFIGWTNTMCYYLHSLGACGVPLKQNTNYTILIDPICPLDGPRLLLLLHWWGSTDMKQISKFQTSVWREKKQQDQPTNPNAVTQNPFAKKKIRHFNIFQHISTVLYILPLLPSQWEPLEPVGRGFSFFQMSMDLDGFDGKKMWSPIP